MKHFMHRNEGSRSCQQASLLDRRGPLNRIKTAPELVVRPAEMHPPVGSECPSGEVHLETWPAYGDDSLTGHKQSGLEITPRRLRGVRLGGFAVGGFAVSDTMT